MKNYRTEEDLKRAIDEFKPEKAIRTLWIEVQKHKAYEDFINNLKGQYEEEYKDLEDYIEYDKVEKKPIIDEETGLPKIDPETGEEIYETIPVLPDRCYKYEEDKETNETVKVLRDECKDKPLKPTLDLYLLLHEEEWQEPEIDLNDYVEFIKPIELTKINKIFEDAMKLIKQKYPQSEIESWPIQVEEAKAYLADNNAPTPMLDNIASKRGIDKALLVNKIIEKNNAYRYLVGQAIGYRQKAEDMLEQVTTIEEFDQLLQQLIANKNLFYQLLENANNNNQG